MGTRYFHTGDIGKFEGGFVFILDRMKDMIIRGGENIDCSEVEAALTMHPAARECSVFGLPDARLGEVVGAAIWCTDPTTTREEILAIASKRIAKFKVGLFTFRCRFLANSNWYAVCGYRCQTR